MQINQQNSQINNLQLDVQIYIFVILLYFMNIFCSTLVTLLL